MNPVIDLISQHRSYRHFKSGHTLPEAEIQAILTAARQAPSWMNGQHYSIIRITDPTLRAQIAAAQPGNPQIASCSEFWVFVADAHRAELASRAYAGSFAAVGTPDTLLTLSVDTAMAAQNAIVAAESLGYAVCPIGGLRQIATQLIDWLALPPHTFPLFGLCIGVPDIDMRLKPRLPQQAVVFENRYTPDTQLETDLAAYEHTMTAFGEAREKLPYRQKFARYYNQTFVPANIALLKQQGLLTHPNGLPGDLD